MTNDATVRLLDLIDASGVPYWVELGISVDSAEEGHVRLRLPMREGLGTRRPEVMHGGAIGALLPLVLPALLRNTKVTKKARAPGPPMT